MRIQDEGIGYDLLATVLAEVVGQRAGVSHKSDKGQRGPRQNLVLLKCFIPSFEQGSPSESIGRDTWFVAELHAAQG
jgi:hypothetical protein